MEDHCRRMADQKFHCKRCHRPKKVLQLPCPKCKFDNGEDYHYYHNGYEHGLQYKTTTSEKKWQDYALSFMDGAKWSNDFSENKINYFNDRIHVLIDFDRMISYSNDPEYLMVATYYFKNGRTLQLRVNGDTQKPKAEFFEIHEEQITDGCFKNIIKYHK